MKVASLFTGCGGLDLGLHQAGHEIILQCECDPGAQQVLRKAFPGVLLVPDICGLDRLPKETELVAAGFPCIDVSRAGLRQGLEGASTSLVRHVFRLLAKARSEHRPVPWVLLENVEALLDRAHGAPPAVTWVVQQLEALGYTSWAHRIISSAAFGVPNRRRRIFIVASMHGDARDVLLGQGLHRCLGSCMATSGGDCWECFDPDDNNGGGGGAAGKSSKAAAAHVNCSYALDLGNARSSGGVDVVPTFTTSNARICLLLSNGRYGMLRIEDAERLQGLPPGHTAPCYPIVLPGIRQHRSGSSRDSDATAETANRARFALLGNAVTVQVARWLGERLREPYRFKYGVTDNDMPMPRHQQPAELPDRVWQELREVRIDHLRCEGAAGGVARLQVVRAPGGPMAPADAEEEREAAGAGAAAAPAAAAADGAEPATAAAEGVVAEGAGEDKQEEETASQAAAGRDSSGGAEDDACGAAEPQPNGSAEYGAAVAAAAGGGGGSDSAGQQGAAGEQQQQQQQEEGGGEPDSNAAAGAADPKPDAAAAAAVSASFAAAQRYTPGRLNSSWPRAAWYQQGLGRWGLKQASDNPTKARFVPLGEFITKVGPAPSDIAMVTYLQRLKEQGWNVDRTERKMMMCGVQGLAGTSGGAGGGGEVLAGLLDDPGSDAAATSIGKLVWAPVPLSAGGAGGGGTSAAAAAAGDAAAALPQGANGVSASGGGGDGDGAAAAAAAASSAAAAAAAAAAAGGAGGDVAWWPCEAIDPFDAPRGFKLLPEHKLALSADERKAHLPKEGAAAGGAAAAGEQQQQLPAGRKLLVIWFHSGGFEWRPESELLPFRENKQRFKAAAHALIEAGRLLRPQDWQQAYREAKHCNTILCRAAKVRRRQEQLAGLTGPAAAKLADADVSSDCGDEDSSEEGDDNDHRAAVAGRAAKQALAINLKMPRCKVCESCTQTTSSSSRRCLLVRATAAAAAGHSGAQLSVLADKAVGADIEVWWPLDQAWYKGVISAYDKLRVRHTVNYEDGDVEIIPLWAPQQRIRLRSQPAQWVAKAAQLAAQQAAAQRTLEAARATTRVAGAGGLPDMHGSQQPLTAMERERLENIERNKAMMEALMASANFTQPAAGAAGAGPGGGAATAATAAALLQGAAPAGPPTPGGGSKKKRVRPPKSGGGSKKSGSGGGGGGGSSKHRAAPGGAASTARDYDDYDDYEDIHPGALLGPDFGVRAFGAAAAAGVKAEHYDDNEYDEYDDDEERGDRGGGAASAAARAAAAEHASSARWAATGKKRLAACIAGFKIRDQVDALTVRLPPAKKRVRQSAAAAAAAETDAASGALAAAAAAAAALGYGGGRRGDEAP